jgi:hypothetical protein
MHLILTEVTEEDLPTLTEIYMSSFTDLISLAMFPHTATLREWWTAMNSKEIGDPGAQYLKVIDTDEGGATVVAYAKWNLPDRRTIEERQADNDDDEQLPEWPADANKELANYFFGQLMERKKRLMGERPHYCMFVLYSYLLKYAPAMSSC